MEDIKYICDGICHVVSEPGDCTCYDFFVIADYDNYCITPYGSTFRFPQRINFYEDTDIYLIAERENCNPCTVKECLRIIKLIREV